MQLVTAVQIATEKENLEIKRDLIQFSLMHKKSGWCLFSKKRKKWKSVLGLKIYIAFAKKERKKISEWNKESGKKP